MLSFLLIHIGKTPNQHVDSFIPIFLCYFLSFKQVWSIPLYSIILHFNNSSWTLPWEKNLAHWHHSFSCFLIYFYFQSIFKDTLNNKLSYSLNFLISRDHIIFEIISSLFCNMPGMTQTSSISLGKGGLKALSFISILYPLNYLACFKHKCKFYIKN